MIARLVAFSTHHPWVILALTLVGALGGELGRRSLSRDVVPDLSDPQIVLVADWMGHPATEVAAEVTKVITTALEGVPKSTATQSATFGEPAQVQRFGGETWYQ